MFNTSSEFTIVGKALGLDIHIVVTLAGTGADASPLPAMGKKPLIVDTQNVQTVLLSALNGALIQLQHMDHGVGGMSIDNLRVGRAATPTAPPAAYDPAKDGKLQ